MWGEVNKPTFLLDRAYEIKFEVDPLPLDPATWIKLFFFVAGGTGGHLFPAIAVAKYFKKSQSHFLIDKRVEKIL